MSVVPIWKTTSGLVLSVERKDAARERGRGGVFENAGLQGEAGEVLAAETRGEGETGTPRGRPTLIGIKNKKRASRKFREALG